MCKKTINRSGLHKKKSNKFINRFFLILGLRKPLFAVLNLFDNNKSRHGISPNLTTYLYMQNKDDSHRPCFALLRRVGTLLAVQLKDVLSRRCASLSPKGKAFSLCTCVPLSPKGENNKKIACYNKKDCASIFLIEAQPFFILSFFSAQFLNAISLIYRLIAAYLPFNCKIRTSMRLLYLQNISGYLAS